MRWLFALVEESPKLTPEEWAVLQHKLQEEQIQQQMQQWQDATWWPLWLFPLIELLSVALTVWMIISCIRHDSERSTLLWILFCFPGLGPVIYFFARWLPSTSFEVPTFLKRWTSGNQIRRLEAAAQQIGNPYQFIELGDALRETKQREPAAAAYRGAIQKEPQNLPALWGLANSVSSLGANEAARIPLESILKIDPAYKFGDVSLLYGRTLHALHDREAELAHWRTHLKRWQQPEALYSLAQIWSNDRNTPKPASCCRR